MGWKNMKNGKKGGGEKGVVGGGGGAGEIICHAMLSYVFLPIHFSSVIH